MADNDPLDIPEEDLQIMLATLLGGEGGEAENDELNARELLAELSPEPDSALDVAIDTVDVIGNKVSKFAGSMGRGFNGELAGLLGLPGEIAESLFGFVGLSPNFVGVEETSRILNRMGIKQPQGNEIDVARNIGRTMLGGMIGGAATLGRGLGLNAAPLPALEGGSTAGASPLAQNLQTRLSGSGSSPVPISRAGQEGRLAAIPQAFDEAAAVAGRRPIAFARDEAVASAGAGVGLTAAEAIAPDSPVAAIGGEIAGAMLPGIALSAAGTVGRETLGLTKRGTEQRVAEFFQDVAGGADQAVAKAERLGTEESISGKLTPGQALGDSRMLGLERSFVRKNDEARAKFIDQTNEGDAALNDAVRNLEPGELTRQVVDEFFRGRIDTAVDLLDTNLKNAIATARERIAELPPNISRESASRLARELIDEAEVDARDLERLNWGNVDKTTPVRLSKAKAVRQKILNEFDPVTQKPDDMPQDILDRIDALDEVEDLGRIQDLRSTILEDQRIARAPGQQMRRRMVSRLNELQEALLDDMGATASAMERDLKASQQTATAPTSIEARRRLQNAQNYRTALNYSAELNDRFTRGPVGKLLGVDRSGTLRTSEVVTLDRIMQAGPIGKEQMRAIVDAVGGNQRMNTLMEDFMRDAYTSSVVTREIAGERLINDKAHERFMDRHRELIDEFPELKAELNDSARATAMVQMRLQQKTRTESMIEKSRAQLWLNSDDINRSFREVFFQPTNRTQAGRNRRIRSAPQAMRNLVASAGKDPTGQALPGLRREFANYLLSGVQKGRINPVTGDPLTSAKSLSQWIKNNRGTLNELYTGDQIDRLSRISEEFLKMQRSIDSSIGGGSDTFENLSVMQTVVARVVGARLGASAARGTPGGSIQSAQIGARFVRGLVNKMSEGHAMALIEEALLDPKKMREMLLMKVGNRPKEAVRLIRGYLLEAGIPDPDPLSDPQESPDAASQP